MIKNFKLFGLFNVLDLFVVAVIIAVASGTVYKYSIPGMSNSESKLIYTVDITNAREFSLQYYQPGLKCFDTKTGEYIGTIVDVRSYPHRDLLILRNGEIVMTEMPDVVRIEFDIEAEGVEKEHGYFVRGVYELKIGATIPISTKYVEVSTTIRQIRNN